MFKILVALIVIGIGVYIIGQQLPDIQRYLNMRSM